MASESRLCTLVWYLHLAAITRRATASSALAVRPLSQLETLADKPTKHPLAKWQILSNEFQASGRAANQGAGII
jgi:hypothetical protein